MNRSRGQVLFQLILAGEGVYIDPLQGITVLIAPPVSAGRGLDLESGGKELFAVVDVGAAAKVYEIIAGPVNGYGLILGQFLNQLCLEFLVFEKLVQSSFLFRISRILFSMAL